MPKSKDVLIGQADVLSKLMDTMQKIADAYFDENGGYVENDTNAPIMPDSHEDVWNTYCECIELTWDTIKSLRAQAAALPDVQADQGTVIAENALQAPAIPAGYKLVPVEPTEAMLSVAGPAIDNYYDGTKDAPFKGSARVAYQAMLAAAPTPAHGDGWLPIESAPKDDPISSIAYKATDKFGNVCHFGVRSLAEVWAKGGTVEEVPSRNLIVITGIRGQPLPPPPEKDTKP